MGPELEFTYPPGRLSMPNRVSRSLISRTGECSGGRNCLPHVIAMARGSGFELSGPVPNLEVLEKHEENQTGARERNLTRANNSVASRACESSAENHPLNCRLPNGCLKALWRRRSSDTIPFLLCVKLPRGAPTRTPKEPVFFDPHPYTCCNSSRWNLQVRVRGGYPLWG